MPLGVTAEHPHFLIQLLLHHIEHRFLRDPCGTTEGPSHQSQQIEWLHQKV
jgi:hypothetical protein